MTFKFFQVNFDFEFDEVGLAKKLIKFVEPRLNIDWDLEFKSSDPFDLLLDNDKNDGNNSPEISTIDKTCLEFSLAVIKAIAYQFSDMAELLIIKLKSNLIRLVCLFYVSIIFSYTRGFKKFNILRDVNITESTMQLKSKKKNA